MKPEIYFINDDEISQSPEERKKPGSSDNHDIEATTGINRVKTESPESASKTSPSTRL